MAHNLDFSKGRAAFVSFAQPAWHGLGKVLNNPLNTLDALEQGGLNFEVLKLPNVHILPNEQEIISTDSFFTVRTDVNKVLGSRLGSAYEVMQNHQALNIVDEILQQGTATIETAGAIDEGRKVFICLKFNENIKVNGSDIVNPYALICTSHDGSMSIIAMQTNIRVVCNNTLTAALSGKQDKIKIRHTSNASDRLREAAKVLKLIHETTVINEENYNIMAQTVISKEEMFNYFGNIFLNEEEIKKLQAGNRFNDAVKTQKQNQLAEVLNFATTGTGQKETLKGSDFTMWTAYNAVTGYVTRRKYESADARANSLLFGTGAETITEAATLALNPAKIQPLHKLNNLRGLNFN